MIINESCITIVEKFKARSPVSCDLQQAVVAIDKI